MSVDKVNAAETQARQLAQKKRSLEDEKNRLEAERAQAERDRAKAASQMKEKSDREVVEISKAGEQQVELVKKMNSERVRTLNENTQKNYLALSENTAEEIRRMDSDALKSIQNHRLSTMERVRTVTDQTQDPFYRLKSLSPALSESEKNFVVKVNLTEQEAQNLFVASEGQSLKLSLARRFQEQVKSPEQSLTTKTSSYQTVVETLNLPGPVDARGIKREFANGVVTITVPKAGTPQVDTALS